MDIATGDTKYLVLTDLEPNGARSVIPCLDEPDIKAIFQLDLTHDPALTMALSNEDVRETAASELITDVC